MTIRTATSDDIPAMVILLEAERHRYADWQPVMWREAPGSTQKTLDWFPHLIKSAGVIALASENNTKIDGFLIAFPQPAPPVYDPGLTYMLDDFCVADDAIWQTVGSELLSTALEAVKTAGAIQCLSVCPIAHTKKAKLLQSAGLLPASTWSAITL